MRVAAFVSGGALPPAVRGTRQAGMIHGCDCAPFTQHTQRACHRLLRSSLSLSLSRSLSGSVSHTSTSLTTPCAAGYATFAGLAGQDPTDQLAASSGLPPIDSMDVWPLISGRNGTSPRAVLPLDARSIIVGEYKLLLGSVIGGGGPT